MAATIRCSIITPTQSVLDNEVTYASIPVWDGQMGIMTGGSPVLAKLGAGTMRLDFPQGGSRWYLLDGGFAEFRRNELSVLTEAATPAEKVSLAEAEAELAEANARVAQTDQDQRVVQHQQQRALAKIALAKAHRSRGGVI